MEEKDQEEIQQLQWRMDVVVRAWDPNLTPQSEFRGIVWDGALTCLCQYFHPLVFEELFDQKEMIQADILRSKQTNHSSIDFVCTVYMCMYVWMNVFMFVLLYCIFMYECMYVLLCCLCMYECMYECCTVYGCVYVYKFMLLVFSNLNEPV